VSSGDDPRAQMLARWERAAPGWGRAADRLREGAMPVSLWMIDHADLQPGQRVLELAAGPGDTGFLAAELIAPGGTLVSSDASEAMLDIARTRAEAFGLENVEFARLELEWIDLETASADAVLCRWGVMLLVDPAAALTEIRRVLRPGGRATFAVWDGAEHNPWATVPGRALIELGHADPPDPKAPGMFAMAAPGQLEAMLGDAGFVDVTVDAIQLDRGYSDLDEYVAEVLDLSRPFAEACEALDDSERGRVRRKIAELAEPYADGSGALRLPGRSLVAAASA
jgi:SAM-dependent methyltransferase